MYTWVQLGYLIRSSVQQSFGMFSNSAIFCGLTFLRPELLMGKLVNGIVWLNKRGCF